MTSPRATRRDFMKAVGLGTACTSLGSRAGSARPSPRSPNIVLIMVDDLGKEWLSCYGGQEMETPHLDRLARGGIRFTNAYSMPQCTPTRATLLTGQYPFRHGWINHWDVPRWGAGCHFDWNHNYTFARLLRDAGYATAAAGKWQINDFRVQTDAMKHHGFDEWCMWTGYETGNPASAERYWDPYIHTNHGSRTYEGRFGADVFADFLIGFMKRHRDQPQLLYFPMALTHTPFTTTPLEPKAEGSVPRHKAMVRYTDHIVGRLVNALEELGLRGSTIVIFTTDNGTGGRLTARMNGRKVRGGKATLGEPGVCEPFIVNGPGLVPEGVVCDALTDFTDLLPTFAELASVQVPEGLVVDGCSFANVIQGHSCDSDRAWIAAMGAHPARLTDQGVFPAKTYADRVVRDKRYKLWVLEGAGAKLFDLVADPAETHNLIDSADPESVAGLERLEAVVRSFPDKDGRPRYDPTPPQPWDLEPPWPRPKQKG